jgi:hypothetical protein
MKNLGGVHNGKPPAGYPVTLDTPANGFVVVVDKLFAGEGILRLLDTRVRLIRVLKAIKGFLME